VKANRDAAQVGADFAPGRAHEFAQETAQVSAESGPAARPDAILLDLAIPDMDGASFLEVIRSSLRLQAPPVVVPIGL
jgi:CheY-like chemotaxis protein